MKKCYFICLLISFISSSIIAQPIINSFSPTSGPIGTSVIISGTNFSTTPASNIVFFGAVRANVSAATATSLTVTVPTGATYKPVTVTTGGLTSYSSRSFLVTFSGGGQINSSSFGARQDFTTDIRPNAVALSDFDGDGKIDVATANNHSNAGLASVSILRNTSSGGTISFAPKQDIVTGGVTYCIASADIDGDGKHDIISGSIASTNISVFRNTSTIGNISFAPKIDFAVTGAPYDIAAKDIDGDGKTDIAIVDNGITFQGMSVFRNTGTIGTISFAPKVDFATQLSPKSIISADLDGDGKTDIGFTNENSNSFSIYRNTSSAGAVSFASRIDYPCGAGNVPYSMSIADIDGDSKTDVGIVYTNNSAGGGIQLYRNLSTTGTITLNLTTSLTGGAFSNVYYHSAFDDFNGDGKPDIALSIGSTGTTRIYPNNSTAGVFSFGTLSNLINSFAPYTVSVGDLDGDGRTDLIETEFTQEKISVFKNNCGSPVITTFNPSTGGTGTVVTIFGLNFTGATAVKFGGVPAASFSVISANSISATVGSGASGDIEVTNALGTGSLPGFIFSAPPTISSFTPSNAGNSTTVTITGTNFNGTTAVSFGGLAATSFNVINSTSISAVVGSGASGNVSVTNPFGTATLGGFIFIPAPVITSFTPSSGGTGTVVAITGNNFTGATSVSFGGVAASSFTINSPTSITATVGIGGSGNVAVTTAGGTGLLGFYVFPPPAITSVSPLTGIIGTVITINGTGFSSIPSENIISFGAVRATVLSASPNQLTTSIPAGAVYGPVSVTRNNLTATSNKNFIPSFAGGTAFNSNSFVPVFDTLSPNLVTGFALTDFDGDFKPDVAFSSNTFRVHRNTSTVNNIAVGPRTDFVVGAAPTGTAYGDFDGDGKPDAAVANFSSSSISVLRNLSTVGVINFAPKIDLPAGGGQPDQIVITDIDVDGKPDIVVGIRNPNMIRIFRNNSFGNIISFNQGIDISTALPYRLQCGDLDNDGKPDIVYTDGTSSSLNIIRNTSVIGNISFVPNAVITVFANLSGFAIGDLNDDTKPEIAVTAQVNQPIAILQNISIPGNINFSPPVNFPVGNDARLVLLSDFDGDTKPDICVGRISFNFNIIKNTSTSGVLSFNLPQIYTGSDYTAGVIDINLDGKADFVGSSTFGNSYFRVIKNQVGGPNITSFSPASGFTGNSITITGTGFTGATAVSFGGTPAASFNIVNSTTITAVIATGTSGNIEVFTPNGTAIKPGFIYIGPPVITSFSPAIATTNNTIVITGTDLAGATAVSFGGVPAASFGIVSSTSINATVGTGASGNVSVTTGAGTGTKSGFTYIGAPAITSFTPAAAAAGTTVTITGVNFLTVSNVFFGGVPASSFTLVNSTTITAVVFLGASGAILVASTNGSAIIQGFVYIEPPTITSFTPTSAPTGATITITGTNLTGATAVSLGGIAATSFTVVNPTTITAIVGNGATGSVSVTTPGGTATSAGFTYTIVTGIGGVNNNSPELVISPNPSNEIVVIKHPGALKNGYIKLIDINGRTVKLISLVRNTTQTTLSVKELPSGLYKLIWIDDKRIYKKTVMVIHQ